MQAAQWLSRAYSAAFGLYVAGLVLWLTLGVLPPLTMALDPLHSLVEAVAGGGPLAGYAGRILEIGPSFGLGPRFIVEYIFSALNVALGVLLAVQRPRGAVPRLLAIAFIGTAATFNGPSHAVFKVLGSAPLVGGLHFMFHIVSGVAYLWAVVLFPDGRLPIPYSSERRRTLGLTALLTTILIAWICYESSFLAHTSFFVAFFGVLVPAVGMGAQSLRLRERGISPAVRQQSRLLRVGLAPAFAASVLWLSAHAVVRAGAATGVGPTFSAGVERSFAAVFAVVPLVLFVAILRYRLWDIDIVLSRTLLLALLVGFVATVYAATLGATAWALRDRGWSAAVAMVVVGVAVEPARHWCSRFANQLVFGQALTPREAMRTLAHRLEHLSARDELSELTELIVASTRCCAAAVWLVLPDKLVLAAAAPGQAVRRSPTHVLAEPTLQACRGALSSSRCLPVSHEGRLLAVLALDVPPGVRLPQTEELLVHDLAAHAALLVANARLAADLAGQVAMVNARADDLRRSRAQVVAAQDDERRRLERDIHDGAQQELVAVLVGVRTLQRLAARGTPPGPSEFGALDSTIQAATATLHDLCSRGAPAILSAEGLVPALEAAVAAARRNGLEVTLDCCRPARAAPEVEVAVYFCCLEALQNAAKHARAGRVHVSVATTSDEVLFSVVDDGVGFDPRGTTRRSGLAHFAERVAVLGGSAEVESAPGAGTCVRGRVPSVELVADVGASR